MTNRTTTAKTVLVTTASAFALSLAALAPAPRAWAAGTETYQVTGPILEVNDDTIVLKKGRDRWEISRNSETKITGDLRVGARATVMYRMTAASVEIKSPPVAAKATPTDKVPKLYPVETVEKPSPDKMASDKVDETDKANRLKKAAAVETPTPAAK